MEFELTGSMITIKRITPTGTLNSYVHFASEDDALVMYTALTQLTTPRQTPVAEVSTRVP